jgi:cyclohexanecarboxylate-CoA ligase
MYMSDDKRTTRFAASAAIRPEDMLEDGQDVRIISGVPVRKGTLGAFIGNARRLAAYPAGSAEYGEIVDQLRLLAPAVRALGLLDVFEPRGEVVRKILAGLWTDVRPASDLALRYRERGFWRDLTPSADLRRWARDTPDAIAVTECRAGSEIRRMTYREYADRVNRVTAVLGGLGVGPGDVVTVQLPNWWQLSAVVLACSRLGAIAAPVMTAIGGRELKLMMARLEPVAYVTTRTWDGHGHAATLASIADRLPTVRHRIIVNGEADPGEIDLDQRAAEATPDRADENPHAEDPDRVCVVLFTSGTTGSPKAVMHSFNTLYAGYSAFALRAGLTSDDVLYTPHSLGHVAGQVVLNMAPLYLGAQALLTDTWEPEVAVRLLGECGVTCVVGAPVFIEAIARAARLQGLKMPRLRRVIGAAAGIPASLPSVVRADLDVVLGDAWGMTELGVSSLTSADEDPPDWAAHSFGRVFECTEADLRSQGKVSACNPARLFVRGANVCLATMPRDGGEVTVLAKENDGWYDTGDLAIPDGRGGLRLAGRAADRIGGVFMIPAADVEDALREHPDIDDAALVGYGPRNELPCAVVVSSKPLTLEEVRGYLDGIGMSDGYQPTRLELLDQLPRNATGKIDKHHLRTWLSGQ